MDNFPSLTEDIVQYPEEILSSVTHPCTEGDSKSDLSTVIHEMFEMMEESDGVGLAANQVGISKRIFVYDTGEGDRGFMINPNMRYKNDGTAYHKEGCLSVRGVGVNVPRFNKVKMSYYDLDWNKHQLEADGFFARVLQHEFDHLHGITIVSFLNRAQRRKIFK